MRSGHPRPNRRTVLSGTSGYRALRRGSGSRCTARTFIDDRRGERRRRRSPCRGRGSQRLQAQAGPRLVRRALARRGPLAVCIVIYRLGARELSQTGGFCCAGATEGRSGPATESIRGRCRRNPKRQPAATRRCGPLEPRRTPRLERAMIARSAASGLSIPHEPGGRPESPDARAAGSCCAAWVLVWIIARRYRVSRRHDRGRSPPFAAGRLVLAATSSPPSSAARRLGRLRWAAGRDALRTQ